MKNKLIVTYPAVFTPCPAGVEVDIPDLPGAYSIGSDFANAIIAGQDAIRTTLTDYALVDVPVRSHPYELQVAANQTLRYLTVAVAVVQAAS